MFEDYTIQQLLVLRSLFAEIAPQGEEAEAQTDVLLIVQRIDEELTRRERAKSA